MPRPVTCSGLARLAVPSYKLQNHTQGFGVDGLRGRADERNHRTKEITSVSSIFLLYVLNNNSTQRAHNVCPWTGDPERQSAPVKLHRIRYLCQWAALFSDSSAPPFLLHAIEGCP